MSANVVAELTTGFDEPFQRLGHDAVADRDSVVISWPTVPVEIVRAAGFQPVLAQGIKAPTPAAAAVLEQQVFPSRLRHLCEAALTGRLAEVAAIVLPRTAEADYKCFLYLREFVRRGLVPALPPILLFDLLLTDNPAVPSYNTARTRTLFEQLAAIAGRQPNTSELCLAIDAANGARAAARRLNALRDGRPLLTGTEALPLLAAFWNLPPDRYATLAARAAEAIARRAPCTGPRVLLAGAPVASALPHAGIEAQGAVVTAELSPYGTEVATADIEVGADPFAALAAHYQTSTITARTPPANLTRRIDTLLPRIDAVAIALPPDDATFGWDYPALRDRLTHRGLPHTVLRGDPEEPPSADDRERIARLLAEIRRPQAVLHG